MKIVEVGIKLNNDLEYYDKILREHGLVNDFYVQTHDIYYTNKSLDGLSEKEMKDACIRLRSCNNGDYDSNQIIYECDNCHITVHQKCYGIDFSTSVCSDSYKSIF